MEMFTKIEEEKDKMLSLTEQCFKTAERVINVYSGNKLQRPKYMLTCVDLTVICTFEFILISAWAR